MNDGPSPYIKNHTWGQITVEGESGEETFKDVKLFPGGSRKWDWNETGTHHQPGIQPADVEELIEQGSEVIVLSKGVYERLGVCEETKRLLEEKDLEYHIEETKKAISIYNDLQKDQKVGGLFHSTC